ncbi:MAG TPA: hypothetical protein VFU23_16305 [Gemmatimonadales bacterium]|nr:hypothetical protein [Gemmatimonadales bacterium]
MRWHHPLAAAALLLATAVPAAAQPPDTTRRAALALRVYIDCGFCDTEFFRKEITFVDHVRDRQVAQVHVLITTQDTGGGGTEYVLKFIGLREFAGGDDELKYVAPATSTSDDTRKGLAQLLKLGLVRFAARLPNARNITIGYVADTTASGTATQPRDPWKNWVFRISANGNFNGEASTKSSYISGTVSANRVTEAWKLRLTFSGNRNRGTYRVDDTTEIKSRSSSYYSEGLIARSLGPHWTAGVVTSTVRSSIDNEDLLARAGPAVEYDFFKYSESTRRLLTLQYGIDLIRARYADTTVFEKRRETLVNQRLTLSLSAQQPWGNANIGVTGSHYLHDFSKNRVEVFGGSNVRVIKGLSFNMFGSYSRVRDQLSLAKGTVSTEDLLLRLRQLKTNYRYFFFTGLSYTFGSIFNNIVNPRFGGGGGNFFCCM